MENRRWQCPKCGSDELEVAVNAWATLTQEDDGNFETDTSTPQDASHEWNENSAMHCMDCDFIAKAGDFDTAPEEPEEDSQP